MANIPKESVEQIKLVHWVKSKTDLPIYANVNQGKRSYVDAALLQRMGMMAGVSDLFIPRATKEYHGCFIEVKVGSGRLSPQQTSFLDEMTKEGYFATAVWGSEAGIQIIKTLYGIQ